MRESTTGGALTEVTYLVLLSLYTPRHGYAIMQHITELTDQRVRLGAGTLYGAIGTLEKKGYIAPIQEIDAKKVYQITAQGKRAVDAELIRLQQIYTLGLRITQKEVHDATE